MDDDLPWELVTRTENISELSIELVMLDDFERSAVRLDRHLRGRGTLAERQDLSPMFGVIWGSARALARRLYDLGDLRGVRVLELGCGLALPSLVAATRGAEAVATDQHPSAGPFLARNAERLGLSDRVTWRRLDWRTLTPDDLADAAFDYVVASDVLFAFDLPEVLAATLARLLRPGATALVCDPGRAWLQEFVDACEALDLSVTTELDRVEHDGGVDDIFVLTIVAGS